MRNVPMQLEEIASRPRLIWRPQMSAVQHLARERSRLDRGRDDLPATPFVLPVLLPDLLQTYRPIGEARVVGRQPGVPVEVRRVEALVHLPPVMLEDDPTKRLAELTLVGAGGDFPLLSRLRALDSVSRVA